MKNRSALSIKVKTYAKVFNFEWAMPQQSSGMNIQISRISILVVSYARYCAGLNGAHKFLGLINHDDSDRFVPAVIDG
jgi:hypothetical protein